MTLKTFYTDGGTANNGQHGNQKAVICITNAKGKKLIFKDIGDKTNNEAELIAILECIKYHNKPLNIISDSQLAVNLVKHFWKTDKVHLQHILYQIWDTNIPIEIEWQPRENNKAG